MATSAYGTLHSALASAQAERPQRGEWDAESGELGWVTHERAVMLDAVNALRQGRGLHAVGVDDVKRAESSACGHVDYTKKFALYCSELVDA